jgi:hypothetical protein
MHDTDDFSALMERVRQGCPEAIRETLQRYGGHIRQVVRQQLHQRMRPQFDSIDFQQDVWASFFCGDPNRYQFDSPEALVRYLSEMAYNKVVEVFRQRLLSPKRDVNRERSLDQLYFDQVAPEVAARHPSRASWRWPMKSGNGCSTSSRRIIAVCLNCSARATRTRKLLSNSISIPKRFNAS